MFCRNENASINVLREKTLQSRKNAEDKKQKLDKKKWKNINAKQISGTGLRKQLFQLGWAPWVNNFWQNKDLELVRMAKKKNKVFENKSFVNNCLDVNYYSLLCSD